MYDYNTCEPVEGAYVEIWHCNSTGVYSGIVANGNGDSSDATNLNKTFLRGVSVTDAEGVVTFDTLFPGHYLSRSNQYVPLTRYTLPKARRSVGRLCAKLRRHAVSPYAL